MRAYHFTPERCAEIVGHCEGGKFRYEAAELAGVTARTLKRWTRLGRDDLDAFDREETQEIGKYGLFTLDLIRAEAVATGKLLKVIENAATDPKEWRAAAWILERKNSQRFGAAAKLALVADDGAEGHRDYTRDLMGKLDAMAERKEDIDKGE